MALKILLQYNSYKTKNIWLLICFNKDSFYQMSCVYYTYSYASVKTLDTLPTQWECGGVYSQFFLVTERYRLSSLRKCRESLAPVGGDNVCELQCPSSCDQREVETDMVKEKSQPAAVSRPGEEDETLFAVKVWMWEDRGRFSHQVQVSGPEVRIAMEEGKEKPDPSTEVWIQESCSPWREGIRGTACLDEVLNKVALNELFGI